MSSSILFRLTAAFAAVILVGVAVTAWVATRTTTSDFQFFVTRSGEQSAAQLAALAGEYYARTGKWDGVAEILQSNAAPMGGMMEHGILGGQGMLKGWHAWTMMNWRVLLLDARGVVIVDSNDAWLGHTLDAKNISGAQTVVVNNIPVGALIVTSLEAPVPNSPAGDFLAAVTRSIVIAALVAGILALGLGAILFRQITAPLHSLTAAAQQIARGDLQARVPTRGDDELAQVARAFNAMADALAQMRAARQNQIADIAHELRTPLAVLRANLEGMQDGVVPLNQEQIAEIHGETLHLARLVDDLRVLSLAETGQLELKRAPADVSTLARGVVEGARAVFTDKGIALEFFAAGAARSNVDADRMIQVLQNLLNNARRYSSRGGRVSVAVRDLSDEIELSVTDRGIGIAPEELPRVFERFHRADKSRARSSGGSGLGLAIVKQLVEAHGGRVFVESEVGSGSRFGIVIPK